MPQNITDVNTWTTPLQDLADGDLIDGAAFLAAQQGVGNRTEFLRKRVYAGESGDTIRPQLVSNDTAVWAIGAAGSAYALNQISAAGASILLMPLEPLPKSGLLTSVSINLAGAAGHAGLPGTMPTLRLYRQDIGSVAAPTQVGATITDTSASVAAYELSHALTITGLTEALAHDSGNRYYIRVTGETGANSVAGLALLDVAALVNPA